MLEELVILVNAQDEVLGQKEKLAAHREGLLHRAFSVMLYRKNEKGMEFLLQKRAGEKYHCGGLWTNTCCSHPRPGEDVSVAALRRLQEEVGVQVPLMPVGHFTYQAHFSNGLTEYEFDHAFVGEYAGMPEHFNREEIAELKWVKAADLQKLLQEQSQQFTPWLQPLLLLLAEKGYC